MKPQRKNFTLYALLAIACTLAGFFFIRSQKLQKELESVQKEAELRQDVHTASLYERLSAIDSLVVREHYSDALLSYEQLLREVPEDVTLIKAVELGRHHILKLEGLQARLRFHKELDTLSNLQTELALKSHQIDSLSNRLTYSERMQQDLFDSLSFALAKAQTRAASLNSQLSQKAKRAYLRFTDKKGANVYYVGDIQDGKAHGNGIGIYSTGNRYEGQWENNQRHGEGTFYWSDGEHYEGSYHHDKRQGQGKYYWPNGEMFSGQWENDKRNGPGIFFGKDGETVATGTWEDNKLVDRSK